MICNYTSDSTYGEFSSLYGNKINSICPLLSKFKIKVLTIDEYKNEEGLPKISEVEKQPMACYILKNGSQISCTDAGVVINSPLISTFSFSKLEKMASFAHEIGHIAFFFLDNKNKMDFLCEEIYADAYSRKIGLQQHLCTVLKKLIKSKLYSEDSANFMTYRYDLLNKKDHIKDGNHKNLLYFYK